MNRSVIFMALIALILSGCHLIFTEMEEDMPVSKTLTAEDSGRTVTLEAGALLCVEIEGNPTTGYQWELAGVDENVLASLGEPEYVPKGSMIGGGGLYTFCFEAAASGETPLKLVYRRPWEEGVSPHETFEIAVVVQ